MEISTTAAARLPEGAGAAADCFHCGLPVPAGAGFGFQAGGQWRAFCCAGCEAVSRAISGLGLDDYYRLRDTAPATPDGEPADLASFDEPTVQARFVRPVPGGGREAELLVEGLRCAACAWLVEQAVAREPGVESVQAHYASRRLWVRWGGTAAGPLPVSRVLGAIRRVGYRAWPYEEGRLALIEAGERRGLLRRLWVAGLAMMQVMMYAWPAYIAAEGEIAADIESLMRWAGFALTVPVVGYSAWPFFRGAWRDLRLARLGMEVPIALGIGVAFGASAWSTFAGRGEVYFDSVTMFVFLLLGGRYLELLARSRAGQSLQHLARLVPQVALRLTEAGGHATEAVPVALLAPGDRLLVRPGESLPADGTLESGEATVSEAWLSGESRPLARRAGDPLTGGSVNAGHALVMRVTRVGAETALSAIHRLMERALAERPPWVAAAERASAIFVAFVLLAALAAAIAWWQVDPSRALWIAVSVLVVTCPCALALATPTALTVASGAMARRGFVMTRPGGIEALARTTDFVLDKTGTLTTGAPSVLQVVLLGRRDEAAARALAASLAKASSHPLDRALAAAAGGAPLHEVASHRSHEGAGVEGRIGARRLRMGRADFVRELHGKPAPVGWIDGSQTVVWLGDEQGWIAAFRMGDAIRPGAREALDALRATGARLHLLSGDGPGVTARVAAELGIADFEAGATPERKQRFVRALQARGARVAMVGDGINDAPVLAQADVSIAMGGGADLAQVRADAVLLSDSVADLAAAVALARRARRVVRQNLAWALAYNLVVIPLAFAGLVTPLVAGIGMSASSLLVVANALRLRR